MPLRARLDKPVERTGGAELSFCQWLRTRCGESSMEKVGRRPKRESLLGAQKEEV